MADKFHEPYPGHYNPQFERSRPQSAATIRSRHHGGRETTFQKMPAGSGRQNLAFTGRGFIPDYMSEGAATQLPEASRTTLENEGVYGENGMMPPAGRLTKLQAGQKTDEGSGGAGSFATVTAYGAKG